MRRGASIVLTLYSLVIVLVASYWSILAAAIIGIVGLGILTVWSCCAVGAEADRAMDEMRRKQ